MNQAVPQHFCPQQISCYHSSSPYSILFSSGSVVGHSYSVKQVSYYIHLMNVRFIIILYVADELQIDRMNPLSTQIEIYAVIRGALNVTERCHSNYIGAQITSLQYLSNSFGNNYFFYFQIRINQFVAFSAVISFQSLSCGLFQSFSVFIQALQVFFDGDCGYLHHSLFVKIMKDFPLAISAFELDITVRQGGNGQAVGTGFLYIDLAIFSPRWTTFFQTQAINQAIKTYLQDVMLEKQLCQELGIPYEQQVQLRMPTQRKSKYTHNKRGNTSKK
ncbi:Hypothetical_protein [Hexamita inflata]|uniref:Hypothetical_protein n=1 Tax=Hexamita inflata TaxID=28002 RepID=A0ABP1K191_9EUKA